MTTKDKMEKEYYMDAKLKQNLDFCKKIIRKNWDIIWIVDGKEGCGKSLLSRQIASYVDPSFKGEEGLNRIAFSPDEFKEAVLSAQKYQAVIFDEAFRGLGSRSAMSTTNKTINEMLMEMRQRNLFVLLVLPSFFELDKYPAVHRSLGLIHVLKGKGWTRGTYRYFDSKRKKKMYLMGKKTYSYCTKRNFRGRFVKEFDPVDEQEYENKKTESLRKLLASGVVENRYEVKYRTRLYDTAKLLIEKHGYKHKEIGAIWGVARNSVTNFLDKHGK